MSHKTLSRLEAGKREHVEVKMLKIIKQNNARKFENNKYA